MAQEIHDILAELKTAMADYLGGDVSSFSDSDLDGDQRIPISGLISYNWESKQWKNDSTF